jgi:hypothetical protein
MKKILLVFSFILMISFNNVLAATCDSTELKKLYSIANNIKVGYEVETKTVENANYEVDGGSPTMVISNIIIDIYNMTDDIFIIASNNINNSSKTIIYSDTDNGKYKLDTYDNFNALGTYTFDIYAKNEPCFPQKINTIEFAKPIENPYYYTKECKENLDIPFCAQFVTVLNQNIDIFNMDEEIENYRKTSTKNTTTKKEEPTNDNNVVKFITEKKYYFIGTGVLILGIIILVKIVKKRRNQI